MEKIFNHCRNCNSSDNHSHCWYKKNNVPSVCTTHEGTQLDAPSIADDTDDTAQDSVESDTE